MTRIIDKIISKIQKIVNQANGNSVSQEMNKAVGERYVTPGMPQLVRQASAESIVNCK